MADRSRSPRSRVSREAQEFAEWDPNLLTRTAVEAHLADEESAGRSTLSKWFSTRIEFGTAGLRGPMAPGYSCMNDLVILQTCQGLSSYLKAHLGEGEATRRGVVIGYDHRSKADFGLSSVNFARLSAAVFLSQGFRVHLLEPAALEDLSAVFVATPFVPFAVQRYGSACGIMVTASHNPKDDNGYKVYWGNGCQIIPPHDEGIAAAINKSLKPWSQDYGYLEAAAWSRTAAAAGERLQAGPSVVDALVAEYMDAIVKLSARPAGSSLTCVKACYTAMHGVGLPWVRIALKKFGLDAGLVVIEEQAQADPAFPTVPFPNPEERGALDIAQARARERGIDLIVANDPDADRLAVAEFDATAGRWHVFHGNEIGVLLGYWAIKQWKERGGRGRAAVLASVVSSRMLQAIAKVEGVEYYDTLTGFKWIGNKAKDLQAEGVSVLFSYEEALGFCFGDVVADKDGVAALSVMLEMASMLRATEGRTLLQQLAFVRHKYGCFVSCNSYKISRDPIVTAKIFERLRRGGVDGGYMMTFGGASVKSLKDVTLGYDSSAEGGKLDMPATPSSGMIMYEFDNGVTFTMRSSGTEPKVKYYTELSASADKVVESAGTLRSFVEAAVHDMLQPSVNKLESAP